jgi:hypothetical protein
VDKTVEQKRIDRLDALIRLYNEFCKKYSEFTDKSVYLNKDLLYLVVASYFDDIEKFKKYSGSQLADQHKRAAFTIKWVSKIKPIQISSDVKVNKHILLVNSLFAIYTGSAFLLEVTPDNIPEDYYEHLIYTTFYRDVDARQLAGALFLLEKYTIEKND